MNTAAALQPRTLDLDALMLKGGGHATSDDGLCAMEAVAYIAGEPHSFHPACACPVITNLVIALNDNWDAETRQLLKPLIPRLVGTRATRDVEDRRTWLLINWGIRESMPLLLEVFKLNDPAEQLRALAPITDIKTLQAGEGALRAAADAIAPVVARLDSLARARALDLALDLALARALDLDLDLDLARALDLDLDLARARALDLDLDLDLARALARARARALDLALDLDLALARALDLDLALPPSLTLSPAAIERKVEQGTRSALALVETMIAAGAAREPAMRADETSPGALA